MLMASSIFFNNYFTNQWSLSDQSFFTDSSRIICVGDFTSGDKKPDQKRNMNVCMCLMSSKHWLCWTKCIYFTLFWHRRAIGGDWSQRITILASEYSVISSDYHDVNETPDILKLTEIGRWSDVETVYFLEPILHLWWTKPKAGQVYIYQQYNN